MYEYEIVMNETNRPHIEKFDDPVQFLQEMISFRKKTEPHFSVHREVLKLRKISPTLVTLIVQRKRKLTLDRADELAKLLKLNSTEKQTFKQKIALIDSPPDLQFSERPTNRKNVPVSILNDWLNVYVKDFFQHYDIQKKPQLIYQQLASIASPTRVKKCIHFLLKEGHLRRSIDGRIVVESNLSVADPGTSSEKVRKFHKGAFKIAAMALDLFPVEERYANTLVLNLSEERYEELKDLIYEFSEKVKDFIESGDDKGERLYQLIVNLSPVGGNSNDEKTK